MTVDLSFLNELVRRSEVDPLRFARLTGPQQEFAASSDRFLLWRGGNQIGKSHGLAYFIVTYAMQRNPFRETPKLPVKILFVSESWTQMDPFCAKLWELLPKDQIDPRLRYEPGGGIRGFKEPRIVFTSGPAKGSMIVLATYEQGSKRIAGGSYHLAVLDEPSPESVLGEILPRLSRYNGELRIGMTPTPESPPQKYLREMVHDGRVREIQTSMNEANITVQGQLVPKGWKTQAEIESDLAGYLEIERGMREHGDWDPVVAGRWLTGFTPENLFTAIPEGKFYVAVGIDHGAKAGRQSASLVVCVDGGVPVYFLDEAISDERTSQHDDARNILQMLERHPWIGGWKGVDYWVGDRSSGGDIFGNAKSNADLMDAFAMVLGITKSDLRFGGLTIRTPYKNKGSVFRGLRLMNGLFMEKNAFVHEKCEALQESLMGWRGNSDDPLKDRIDSARYALEELHRRVILAKNRAPGLRFA